MLENISHAHGLILGSPIYFGSVSGEMRSFMERLLFPKIVYADPYQTLFSGTMNTGFIYTMNLTEDGMKARGIHSHLGFNEAMFQMVFGASESLFSHDTYQFKDYAAVIQSCFDPEKKAQRRREVFPKECEKAFAMGRRFATGSER